MDDPATGTRHHVPPIHPPAVVDTTGAGDAFNAAFAVAIAAGHEAATAALHGAAAGAFAVSRAEVIPGLPTREELDELLSTAPAPTAPPRPDPRAAHHPPITRQGPS